VAGGLAVLWEDGERVLCRGWRDGGDGDRTAVLAVLSASDPPTPSFVDRLNHEYGLRDELDGRSAVRPLALVPPQGRTVLLLEDPGGETLARLLGQPMELERVLRIAISLSAALRRLHERGLIHKDLRPANVLVNSATGQVWLTGFGMASRLPRERQSHEPPELIAGTLAYIAPEQTGRMNRSIDSRSDLYSLGVMLYEMLTGGLPFMASDPMEWVHCHIARQPVPPIDRLKELPAPVSAIVLKLLAKTAEERYQTAAGIESDLRRCLARWGRQRHIEEFPLGEHDVSDRLLVPEKLYGRAREIDILRAAIDRVVAGGAPELVLISGYSGIGKSSVANELHKLLLPPSGLFATGKFDQYKRDIPYATLAHAFRSLVRRLLGKSEAELQGWRDHLRQALDPNGSLIIDVVPELKLIVGAQPSVPELSSQHAQKRFQLVLRRFISTFARPEHPLALFFDDLQWIDTGTLDFLQDLLTEPDMRHLLLIGAYRDNEVNDAHPLVRKLNAIREVGTRVQDIVLAPLTRADVGQLIAESLKCELEQVAPLAELVHEKTAGNPFFAIQFLYALAEEGLLFFDHDASRWCWDSDRIHAKGYADNVVDLMIGKLARLSPETQKALQQLACLGNTAEITMLAIVFGTSEEEAHAVLWAAVRLELVERLAGAYRFVHDRIQEAAYSLLPEELRAAAHLRIGRLLAGRTPREKREEALFEIVNQLNRGTSLITAREEREQLAEFNLLAGKRAKASAAFASALTYLNAGAALLAEDCWERRHELIFEMELHRAECEFLTGELATAEERLNGLSHRTANTVERATVACLRVDLYTTLGQAGHAIAVSLDYLRGLGTDWSPHPTEEEARLEYERIWSQLGGRAIEELIDLPLMTDAASLATLDVLTKVLAPAMFTDLNLASLVVCRAVNLSLERGNSDGSCVAYVTLGLVAVARIGDYRAAFRFARVGYELVEQRGLKRFQARTYMNFSNVGMLWTKHVRAGRDLVRRAFEAANSAGDLTYAGYACYIMITNLLAAGDALAEVQREAETDLAFAQKAQFGFVIDIIATQLQLVRTLRGLTPKFGSFDDKQFDELRIERRFSDSPNLARAECWYWIRKLQARFLAGDHGPAIDASVRAQRLLWSSPLLFEMVEYHFYGALSLALSFGSTAADQHVSQMEALAGHHRQLEIWAENCPENFENRAALVGAEIARIEGRALDAMDLYERAIRSAKANGFVHNEALANELAGCFYLDRGLVRNGHAHLRDARACYALWGADAKVRQLDRRYPQLTPADGRPTATIGSPLQLDVASVVKASQAVSGEIELPKLIEKLMTIALQNAGADRGLLILPVEDDYFVQAEARAAADRVEVMLCDNSISAMTCPESLVRYVIRTQESVIVDDASRPNLFSEDDYLRGGRIKSILCLPLIKQGRLTGLLYLENTLTSHAFTPDLIGVLELLAAQAAISLENTRLYSDLQEREAKVRRLIDANIIGVVIAGLEGEILEANDAFLKIVGYNRDDFTSGRLRWTELTPAEWLSASQRAVAEIRAAGTCELFEKEYVRKDGSRVPVLVGSAAFGETRSQAVTFVLDLTERKRADDALRHVHMELAHANRVATMGQLTASIAHEVNQPVAATVTNAQVAVRWLGGHPPDLGEVRRSLDAIIKDGFRARDIIGRIRALIKKAPPQHDRLDINEVILEVIEVTRSEVLRNRVSLRTELAKGLPFTRGDRIQLQQVILNLIMNAIEALSDASNGSREGSRDLLISTADDASNGVLVAVRDSGPGLNPESLEHLFDPFYTTKPGGTGMGLSICHSIIEAHGGRIWASSNAPQGASFHFSLPADRVSAA
jgi:PAS domain S-box-containing protein